MAGIREWRFDDDIELMTVNGGQQELQQAATVQKALRESEERYQLIVETAAEGVWVVGADFVTTFANARMADILGVSVEDLVGTSAFDYTAAEVHPSTAANIEKLRRGERIQFERQFVRADGRSIDTLVDTSPLTAPDGTHSGSLALVTDITEHKRRQLEFDRAKQMEAIGGLAGGVAHDFNNSMMAIRGFAELLLSRLEADSPLRRDAEGIKQAADGAAAMTRRLLAFGRQQVLQPEVLDVNEAILSLEQTLKRNLGENVVLELILSNEVGRVSVDPGQLEQVILELTDNAVEAMPDGGRLTIRTAEQAPEHGITRHGQEIEPGRYVMISIADDGTGIAPDVFDRATEPFVTTKELGRGSGMGLPTALGIVKQSGGYFSIETEIGQGSTFNTFFPLVQEASAPAAVASPDVPSGSARTVLLVEDDEVVRAVVAEMLVELGYEVFEAGCSDVALELDAGLDTVDILLTDVVMPGLGGPELATRLRERRPGLRVLFMSGYTARPGASAHETFGAGALFLQKPFTFELLRRRLETLADPALDPEGST